MNCKDNTWSDLNFEDNIFVAMYKSGFGGGGRGKAWRSDIYWAPDTSWCWYQVVSKTGISIVSWSFQLNREVKVQSQWGFQGLHKLHNSFITLQSRWTKSQTPHSLWLLSQMNVLRKFYSIRFGLGVPWLTWILFK